jgi:hypothetical protein
MNYQTSGHKNKIYKLSAWFTFAILWQFAIISHLAVAASINEGSSTTKIGVYYFPGWRIAEGLDPGKMAWDPIKKFPEREPLLGWYLDGEQSVVKQQLQWMAQYKLDYVVYDWYWSRKNKPVLEHTLKAYLEVEERKQVAFSLLWCNHNDVPQSLEQFDQIVHYLVDNYLSRPEYLNIDGAPVLFVFSAEQLHDEAAHMGVTLPQLLDRARAIAREAGMKSIYFVGGSDPSHGRKGAGGDVLDGFDAVSAYQYHGALRLPPKQRYKTTHSYHEMIDAYSDHWDWLSKNTNLPIVLPMSSGTDRRPWGGSPDPMHDNSMSTPDEFEEHLQLARKFILENRERTKGFGIICCWNEYGEGEYIEPTKKYGFSYLEKVRKVFSSGIPEKSISNSATSK